MSNKEYRELHQDEYDAGQEAALMGPGINPYRAAASAPYWQGYIDTLRHQKTHPLVEHCYEVVQNGAVVL